ncbi:MAG: OmpA family protein, partial [Candidatus Latescibacteria bacterium]|nr:OmpA family protein [bacterium]MBD3424726.1 OmpA family protein [Candidatus Latescibacterota bacterium]
MGYGNTEIANSGKPFKRLLLLLYILLCFCSSDIMADIPPAGSSISSCSYATYGYQNGRLTAFSNELTFDVLPVYSPLVLPDGTAGSPALVDSAFSGGQVSFPFTINNGGNAPDSYDLFCELIPPSDFSFSSIDIYLDEDGDGAVDPGEEAVTSVGPMASGESASLLVSASLPGGLAGGERSLLNLTAVSQTDTSRSDRNNVVMALARDEARVPLRLASDRGEVMPGDTIRFTIDFENSGSRTARDLIITDYIDYSGNINNTRYISGSLISTVPGIFEYLDGESESWAEVPPPAERVKGIRLLVDQIPPGLEGNISFMVEVDQQHLSTPVFNSSFADYTGGDSRPYQTFSNEISVQVGAYSQVHIGPRGRPEAEDGSVGDMVVHTLNMQDSVYIFQHEILNRGNFTDTLAVSLPDSAGLPEGWQVDFVDSAGAVIPTGSSFMARLGPVPPGGGVETGLRLSATPGRFRSFAGSRMEFEVESFSMVNQGASDRVRDVLVKTGIPMLSVQQSIKEPVAGIGDLLSCILTVANMTGETMMDSLVVTENLCAGFGYAGGSMAPEINGNRIRWKIGSLGPGEEKKIYFRLRVKVGQQRGNLAATAKVSGVSEYGEEVYSEASTASIKLVEGVFTRKGIVLGNVFLDLNSSGSRERGEPGVADISVYMENGTYCVTDSTGRYSMPGINEGVHVLRIDPQSLPDSLTPADAGHYGLGEKGEVIVDLPPSGSWRIDFPLEKSRFYMEDDGKDYGDQRTPKPPCRNDRIAGYAVVDSAATQMADTVSGDEESDSLPSPPYTVLVFDDRNFRAGSDLIQGIPLKRVAGLSLWLRNHPEWELQIIGHTDSIPISTEEFPSNLELSMARARSVFQLFRMNGIDEGHLDFTGRGAREPVATNSTPEGRSRNRRVEVKAVPPKGYLPVAEDLAGLLVQRKPLRRAQKELMLEITRPEEGRVYRKRDRIEVAVTSDIGSRIDLYVNGLPVGIEKIGRKDIDAGRRKISHLYYDVRIKGGNNEITAISRKNGRKAM